MSGLAYEIIPVVTFVIGWALVELTRELSFRRDQRKEKRDR